MLVTDEVRSYIGVSSEADFACDAVETGAVRRFAQAIMDEDPAYLGYNPSFEFFSSLVPVTHFRPTTPDYSQISSNIQVACESVVTDQATPEQAAATYDEALTSIVGEQGVQAAHA